jgi:triacylglycerol lipase
VAADVRGIVREHGPLNPAALAATQEFFAPLHANEPYAGVEIRRDLAYGPDARHRLDVFMPTETAGGPRPILIYVHGGGFVRGDKRVAGTPFHDNIAVWACRHGMIGVTITYRLAPQHVWPAGPQDVAAAARWMAENAGRFGGDSARVVLFGHSAGAAHVAAVVAHPEFHGPRGTGIAGAILGSGIYDLTVTTSDVERMYFGAAPEQLAARSSARGIVATRVPVMLFLSEFDPPMFQRQALGLLDAFFEKHQRLPRFAMLSGENHFSPVMHLGYDAGDRLGPEVRDFIATECAGAAEAQHT